MIIDTLWPKLEPLSLHIQINDTQSGTRGGARMARRRAESPPGEALESYMEGFGLTPLPGLHQAQEVLSQAI